METRAQHVLIGLFTLLGIGALLLFTFWLSRTGVEGDTRQYDILFHEAVSGLSVGSPVNYSGIRVGEVVSLRLDEEDPRLVWARVLTSSRVPIKEDTKAQLALLNITGAAGIQLSQGSPESPILKAHGIPVIEAEPSPISRLQLNGDEVMQNITLLLNRANEVLSEDNIALFSQMLANIETVTTIVAQEREDLRSGLQSLASAGGQLSVMLEHLEEGLTVEGAKLMSEATQTLGNVSHLTQELDMLLSDSRQSLVQGMQGAGELGPTVQDLRLLLRRLNTLVSELESGPAGSVLGQDDLKEFAP